MREFTLTEWNVTDMSLITSVWSNYGHTFIVVESGYEQCLTCGALYELARITDDSSRGYYRAADGSEPMKCSGDTNMAHGYPGERQDGNSDHNCNCLFCA